jgi:hypothetical protein
MDSVHSLGFSHTPTRNARFTNFVATKAHTQFELGLTQTSRSLKLYGHAEPAVAYTDNLTDKALLESVFPSLRADLVPVKK